MLKKGEGFWGREKTEDNEEFEILLCTSIEEFEQFDNSLNDRDLQKKMIRI